MPHATLYTLAALVDNRAIYAAGRVDGTIREDAPGLAHHEERQLHHLLESALTKLLQLDPLTEAELEASHRALDWYTEFDEVKGLTVDAARELLELWNLPEGLPDRVETIGLGYSIFARSVSENAAGRAKRGAGEPLLMTPGAAGDGNGSISKVPAIVVEACEWAEVRLRQAQRDLEMGMQEEAAEGLDLLIDELRWVRGRVRG